MHFSPLSFISHQFYNFISLSLLLAFHSSSSHSLNFLHQFIKKVKMFSPSTIAATDDQSSTPMVYGRLKKYWRRKRYQRLYPSDYGINASSYDDENAMLFTNNRKKYMKVARFGGGGEKHQKENVGWRLRVSPKVRLRKLLVTPVIKILAGIRDAYVNTMLRLAGNVGSLNGNNVFGGRRIPKARQVKEKKVSSSSKEEFDSRLVYEIYKVLAASQQLNIHGGDAVAA